MLFFQYIETEMKSFVQCFQTTIFIFSALKKRIFVKAIVAGLDCKVNNSICSIFYIKSILICSHFSVTVRFDSTTKQDSPLFWIIIINQAVAGIYGAVGISIPRTLSIYDQDIFIDINLRFQRTAYIQRKRERFFFFRCNPIDKDIMRVRDKCCLFIRFSVAVITACQDSI